MIYSQLLAYTFPTVYTVSSSLVLANNTWYYIICVSTTIHICISYICTNFVVAHARSGRTAAIDLALLQFLRFAVATAQFLPASIDAGQLALQVIVRLAKILDPLVDDRDALVTVQGRI